MVKDLILYNFTPMICFAALIAAAHFSKQKNVFPPLRAASIVLAVYKSAFYLINNIRGQLTVPVEISSISYFIVPIIVAFRIRRAYAPAAFLGIASGIGFFLFYSTAGFTVCNSVSQKELFIGIFSHGYLFFAGTMLFSKYAFQKEPLKIWLTMLAILCWSLLFYDIQQRGITFIYYVIKPQFLFVFSSPPANLAFAVTYYAMLCALFFGAVKLFFALHFMLHRSENQLLQQTKNATAIRL